MTTVLINTKVTTLNPDHGEVYSIQHYMITFGRTMVGLLHR